MQAKQSEMETRHIKVIAFDADDTLWDCQGHFERVMQQLYDELVPWVDRETAALELFATERKNMPLLGSAPRPSPCPCWRRPCG